MLFKRGDIVLFNDDGVIKTRTIMGVTGGGRTYMCYYHDLKAELFTSVEFADRYYYWAFNKYYEEISNES